MFCAYCGKTLINNPEVCPYCGMPVGESHFDGSPYTSAQPRMRPGQEVRRPKPMNTDEAFARTAYRPSSEVFDQPEEEAHEEAESAEETADDLLKPDEETNLDAFDPRPIEVTEQAGISPDVSEIISRMEAEPQRRFGRRRKADYDDYENNVEEETPTAPTGRAASDDQEGVFEDLDDEEMDELRHPAFGMKQVVRAVRPLESDEHADRKRA